MYLSWSGVWIILAIKGIYSGKEWLNRVSENSSELLTAKFGMPPQGIMKITDPLKETGTAGAMMVDQLGCRDIGKCLKCLK